MRPYIFRMLTGAIGRNGNGGGGAPASPYQQWENYPDSPVLTEDYPYQLIEIISGTAYLVMASSNPWYFNGTWLINTGIHYFTYSGGSWGTIKSFAQTEWSGPGSGITLPECNYNIYNESSFTTVYKAKTTA
ncbi:hypothetical protein [Papillibacter cinnamivorans]|uniref:hypothetical protein n=1 Tax=Papillibacter cinnamivorans TaxID=100176 RepID=UPI00117E06E4|nr:hypothetical protein [Papillibacter cinnamivorans]